MSLHSLLARAAFRRSWGGLLGIVLVLAVGLGAAVTAIEAADRTVSAYPDYLERNDVSDLVVNTVLANERTQELLESTPGVRSVVSDSLLTAAPAEDPEGSSDFLQFRVSQDGRYTEQDRPVVDEGRMIRSGDEVFLSRAAAEELDAEVGDVVDVNFYGVDQEDPLGPDPGPVVREVPVEVVGIGTFADSVRPDELFPRMYALVTPEAAGGADCLQLVPDPDDPRGIEELFLAAVRPDCAMTYRYYSLDVEGGSDEAAAVAGELAERFRAENRNLPQALRENNAGYFLIPTFTADDARSIRSSLAPVVAALRVFGVAAGLAVIGAVTVLVIRQHRRRAGDLGEGIQDWSPNGLPVGYPDPVRAPTIIDLEAVRGAPAGLAGLFALGMAGAVVTGLAAGTRARRRELAIVRALGATRRQRRRSVRVHAMTTVVAGLVVGIPLGVAAGRVAFRRLATDMGVADDVGTSLLLVGAVAAGALVIAVLAAEVLARRALVRRPLPVSGATGPPASP